LSTVRDGTAHTILAAENFHVGYALYTWSWAGDGGGPKSGWANADPRFAAFRASDDVCPGGDCTQIRWELANSDDARDNLHGLPERINGGNDHDVPGGLGNVWPYASSRHSGGVNVVFCDGHAQFLDEGIDGTTYAQLISPAASVLSKDWPAFQAPLDEKAF
jgi:prepilin-type processing-associated H-X9-DG protein